MAGRNTHPIHARNRAAHYASFLTPDAVAMTRFGFERDIRPRFDRIIEVARNSRTRGTERMRGLVATGGGRVKWKQVARPGLPGPLGAVVRPIAVATCDADRPIMLGKTYFPLPIHLGHEAVAEVVEVGAEVADIRVGDRVIVPFQLSCGTCRPCLSGNTANCLSVPPASMYGFGLVGGLWGGALADFMAVPFADAMLVGLPDGIDPAAAAGVADNYSDAYRQVAPHLPGLLAADPDAEVLVVGRLDPRDAFTSSTLLITAMIARAMGAKNISVVDGKPALADRAEQLGFRALDPKRPREWPTAALTVDATGTPSGLRKVLAHTAPDGVCTCAWSFHRRAGFPLMASYQRNVTVHVGRAHIRTQIPDVLDLMVAGDLRPDLATTNTASFDDAPAALREHCHSDALKTVLLA